MRYLTLFSASMLLASSGFATGTVAADQVSGSVQPTKGMSNHGAMHNDKLQESALAFANKYYAALFGGDFDTLKKSYAENGNVYGNGRAEKSVRSYLEGHLKPELSMLKDAQRNVTQQLVQASGNIAVVTTSSTLSFVHGAETVNLENVETLTMIHGDGGWKITLSHSSSRRTDQKGH